MEKKLIVVVDTDEEYLSALEYKLLEEWEEKADIEIITQLKYFQEFFGKPRNIFLLVINTNPMSYIESISFDTLFSCFFLFFFSCQQYKHQYSAG